MTYESLSLNKKDKRTNYLNKLPAEVQDIYYTPEYYSIYENYGKGNAKCFIFEKKDEYQNIFIKSKLEC